MKFSQTKRAAARFLILALAITLALPLAAFAQGNGRGRGHRNRDIFVNGHDARDGRTDGRGPRANRDRDDDDDDDNRRERRRNRDGYNNGSYNNTDIRRRALDIGYTEGRRAGEQDRANGERRDYNDESIYRDATAGYQSNYGNIDSYRNAFREGFREGYRAGYNNGYSNNGRSRVGEILGDILGRP